MAIEAAQNLWDILVTGDWFLTVISVFTNQMGVWFYGLIMFATLGTVWMKTQDATMPSVLGLILSAGSIALMPPEFHRFAVVFLALSITGLFYKALH